MSTKRPAFQFYPGDWLKDPSLSMCSAMTRGIWIDLICAMHESGRSGELSGTTEQLARIARCSTAEFDHALAELSTTKSAGVTFRNGLVTLINRRMVREHKRKEQQRLRQRTYQALLRCNAGTTPPSSSSYISSDNPLPLLPDTLGGDQRLQSLWQSFAKHRREIKKPLTPEAARRTLAKLESWGVERAVAALEHSISNGWQGVFEPQGSAPTGPPAPPRKRASDLTPEEISAMGRNWR